MNTGIFGEGFPYSNFHDLNMDWIIKIAKDFLDQYSTIQQIITDGNELLNTTIEEGNELLNTTIEEGDTQLGNTISEGLTSLQNKYDALEALLQQWYNTHSEDIATALANALHDIQTELSTAVLLFSQRASTIADEVAESIPADYSALSDTVNALVSNLINIQGLTQYIDYSRWQANVHWNAQLTLDAGSNYYAYPEITVPAGTYAMCGLDGATCFAKDSNDNITTPFANNICFATFLTETKLYLSCVETATGDDLENALKHRMFGNVIPPRNCYKLGEYGTQIDNLYVKDIIVDHMQAIEYSNWLANTYWYSDGNTIITGGYNGYYAYPPFMLKEGRYATRGIDPTFSYYYDTVDGTFHGFSYSSTGNFANILELEHDAILYITATAFTGDPTVLQEVKIGSPDIPKYYKQGYFGKVIPMYSIHTPFVIVDQQGNGDYLTIQSALDNIEDSANNPVTIFVMSGEYDYFTTAKDNSYADRHINIIGVDPKTCIVKCLTGGYELSAGMVRMTGVLKNLTFYSETSSQPAEGQTPVKYAIHCDFGSCKLRIENCIVKSVCGPAIGIGLSDHQEVELIDSYFETDNTDHSSWASTLGCIYCHNGFEAQGTDQRLTIRNCVAYNKTGLQGACIHEINPADKYLKINNSTFFGNNGGSIEILGTWNKTCSGNNNVEI